MVVSISPTKSYSLLAGDLRAAQFTHLPAKEKGVKSSAGFGQEDGGGLGTERGAEGAERRAKRHTAALQLGQAVDLATGSRSQKPGNPPKKAGLARAWSQKVPSTKKCFLFLWECLARLLPEDKPWSFGRLKAHSGTISFLPGNGMAG